MPRPRWSQGGGVVTMLAIEPQPADERWARIATHAPVLAATARDYLDQISVTARPGTATSADIALRLFASWLIDHDPNVVALRHVNRRHIEHYKLWLATARTARRTVEEDHDQPAVGDAARDHRTPHRMGPPRRAAAKPDLRDRPPQLDEPLPKFLDDDQAAKFMAAATRMDPQWRLVIEMLARTGLRVGEFCRLDVDAIITLGETNWLRVPVGKLHTDRYVPLHPILIELHTTWRDWAGLDDTGLLITNRGRPLDRYSVSRAVARCARIAGIGHVHPHQLRHTMATQAINNGMSLEAIAAMLGHRSMRMTLVYARIADRTVADQYFAAADKVDQLYTTHLTTSPA